MLIICLFPPSVFLKRESITQRIKDQLNASDDPDRTFDVGSKLSGLFQGGFDKLGYIPIEKALEQCDGMARYRVEMLINK